MGRILAIDYGEKRVGIAVTDELRMISTPLGTINTGVLFSFLDDYMSKEEVDIIVIGWPLDLNGEYTDNTNLVQSLAIKLKKHFSNKKKYIKIDLHDERHTTKMSLDTMIMLGLSKNKRNKKSGYLDKISATLMLQSYLELKKNQGKYE